MAFVITDHCTGCKHAECVDVCPMDSIHPTPNEAAFDQAPQLYINPDTCIDCNLCASSCPEQAIYQEDDLPSGKERFVQINAQWFEGAAI